MTDALIVGAGPAGVSCAVWLARLGFEPVLFEAGPQVGGLCLTNPYPDIWNAVAPRATGIEVAHRLAQSLDDAGVPLHLSSRVTGLVKENGGFLLQTERGATARGRFLVLATGVRARRLEDTCGQVVAEDMPGILVGPGAHVAAQDFSGKTVAVLGGGDNAFENALYAMEHGAREVRVHARTIRAQRQFARKFPVDRIAHGPAEVDAGRRTVNGRPYDLILVLYGWEPCVPPYSGFALARDARGFLRTEMQTAQTSEPGVYAIGEVAQRQHPCAVTALADGVTAAKAIQARIEAGSA